MTDFSRRADDAVARIRLWFCWWGINAFPFFTDLIVRAVTIFGAVRWWINADTIFTYFITRAILILRTFTRRRGVYTFTVFTDLISRAILIL